MKSDIVHIDGSIGEGGGQILRTSLMLSIISGRPFEISNIRSKRPNPGLRPQHLAALKAFTLITGGRLVGDQIGSTNIRFVPGEPKNQDIEIDVGTAGSITLILSTLLPALSFRGEDFSVTLKGGTDTKWSPTFDYFNEVVVRLYRSFGINCDVRLVRRGYYPVGGGEVVARIRSGHIVKSFKAIDREDEVVNIKSVCSNLPIHVAERQARAAKQLLENDGVTVNEIITQNEYALSAGSVICIYIKDLEVPVYIGGDSVGQKGVSAEDVGFMAARNFLFSYNKRVALDVHCADMAIPLMCLTEEESQIGIPSMTGHIVSNMYVSSLFTAKKFVQYTIDGKTIIKTASKVS